MVRHIATAATILLTLLSAGAARADERNVIVALGISEVYNDNIFFSYEDELEDWINRLTGNLQLLNRTERSHVSLSARMVNHAYAEYDELDGLDHNYSGRIGYQLTPDLEASLNATYSRETQPDRDIDVTGLLLDNEKRDVYDAGASLQCALNEITTTSISYRYNEQDYEDNASIDSTAHQGEFDLTRRLDRYWNNLTGRLNVNVANYDYETNRTDYYAATIGFLWDVTEVWQLQADGGTGYAQTEFDYSEGRSSEAGWGIVGRLSLDYRGEYMTAGITASRDVRRAGGRDGPVVRTSGEATLQYRFTENAWVGLRAGYHRNKAEAGKLAPWDIDERTLNGRPYLRYELMDNLALEASYSYTLIEDLVFNNTRERNLALLNLTYEYSVLE